MLKCLAVYGQGYLLLIVCGMSYQTSTDRVTPNVVVILIAICFYYMHVIRYGFNNSLLGFVPF